MFVPSPSWPEELSPQQYAAPLVVTPQVCSGIKVPPALSVANVKPPATGVGMSCWAVVPSPSWPKLLEPQQNAWPDALRAHEWKPPASTWIGTVPVAMKCRGLSAAPGVLAVSAWSPGVEGSCQLSSATPSAPVVTG